MIYIINVYITSEELKIFYGRYNTYLLRLSIIIFIYDLC